jgi:hypothetical protein
LAQLAHEKPTDGMTANIREEQKNELLAEE